MGNRAGRATALTVMSPMKPGWPLILRLRFRVVQRLPVLTKDLRRLSFIHFAYWSLVDRLPYHGPPQEEDRLHSTYLLFESNFNGMWDEYIDAFSAVLPDRMKGLWGSSYGFPGPVPVGPFKDYIRDNEYEVGHYYSAYPQASATMIQGALALQRRFSGFARQLRDEMTPEEFQAAYHALLTDVQRQL